MRRTLLLLSVLTIAAACAKEKPASKADSVIVTPDTAATVACPDTATDSVTRCP